MAITSDFEISKRFYEMYELGSSSAYVNGFEQGFNGAKVVDSRYTWRST